MVMRMTNPPEADKCRTPEMSNKMNFTKIGWDAGRLEGTMNKEEDAGIKNDRIH
jgi:hypothetical protein